MRSRDPKENDLGGLGMKELQQVEHLYIQMPCLPVCERAYAYGELVRKYFDAYGYDIS